MNKSDKRAIEVLVLSDIHLGTFGCRASELLKYLQSVDPKILVLNGDIIDVWQFNKRYFPKAHMRIVLYLSTLLARGTQIYYVTGNHDEMLRRFEGFELGSFKIVNKLLMELDGKKVWIFHGDVFDVTMKHSKWLARLGGVGYDVLIMINTLMNWTSRKFGRGRISLSRKIKNSVKSAVKYINNFEEIAAEIAISNGYDYVICGHIHQPQIRTIKRSNGSVTYLNSGDWIENLTALEYADKKWSMYVYSDDDRIQHARNDDSSSGLFRADLKHKELFEELTEEFLAKTLKA